MRVLVTLLIMCSANAANDKLVNIDDIKTLFTKFMLNDLAEQDIGILKDTVVVLKSATYASGLERHPVTGRSEARSSFSCMLCRSLVGGVVTSIRNGQSDEEAIDALVKLCTNLGVQSHAVCKGVMELNIPILAYIIKNEPQATAETFCGLVLQTADDPDFCYYNDSRFEWKVELPKRHAWLDKVAKKYPANNTPLKVAILTDVHIDPLYKPFSVAECDEPLCCRVGQTPKSYSNRPRATENLFEERMVYDNGELKLNLSIATGIREQNKLRDSHDNNQWQDRPESAGYWGDYRNCDTPVWAFDDTIDNIHENHKDIEVIYYIGDTINHGVWMTSYELVNNTIRYAVEKIRQTFGDHVKVVPVIGNHDSHPTNQFAPSSIKDTHFDTAWLYETIVNTWGFYLPDEAKQSILKGGDFSVSIRQGLRVISLNNNVSYRYNWWLMFDPLDAKKHLDWLIQELYKAELAGEKVHILTHIPPGVADLTHTWTREYNRIVNRFSTTIAAEFNGHTHLDEFKVFYSPDGQPINVAWSAGGVTTYTYYNLNYKITTFNAQTFIPEKILNYSYNLTEANLSPHVRPKWRLLYNLEEIYGLDNLSAESIHTLIHSMVKDTNTRLLNLYSAFSSKVSDVRWPDCDDKCKIDTLCRTVITVLWQQELCTELEKESIPKNV